MRPEAKTEDSEELPTDKLHPKESNAEPLAQWRAHMADGEVQGLYRQSAATVECVTALACHWGVQRPPLRGLAEVRAVAYFNALAHRLMRMAKIAPQLIGRGASASAATLAPV